MSSRSQSLFSAVTSRQRSVNRLLPPHIGAMYKLHRNIPNLEQLTPTHWTRPYVLLHYARPFPKTRWPTKLFIYASWVTMGSFDRGFVVYGCLVGNDVHPWKTYKGDVFSCNVPREIVNGEFISLVLPYNNYVDEQSQSTVQIHDSINVTLLHGDIIPLSDDIRLHFQDSDLKHNKSPSLMCIKLHQKFEALGDVRDPEAADSQPRYEVCLATQFKPFTNYIHGWIS
ncbi:unnamed protein product [Agarophyton chilense]